MSDEKHAPVAPIDPVQHAKQSIAQYGAHHRDVMLLKERSAEHTERLNDEIAVDSSVLEAYLAQKQATCIPVLVHPNPENPDETSEMYIRLITKPTKRGITEKTLHEVLKDENPLTLEELAEAYDECVAKRDRKPTKKDPVPDGPPKVGEVYLEALMQRVEDENVSYKTKFELTESKERGFKRAKNEAPPTLPVNIQGAVTQLYKSQHDQTRLKEYIKDRKSTYVDKKKKLEPEIDQYLAQKPEKDQTQRVSLKMGNVKHPYILTRHQRTRRPPLSFAKSKSFFNAGITDFIASEHKEMARRKFDLDDEKTLQTITNPTFQAAMRQCLLDRLEDFKSNNVTRFTEITFDREDKGTKRKREDDEE
jgi:hypothetical protein